MQILNTPQRAEMDNWGTFLDKIGREHDCVEIFSPPGCGRTAIRRKPLGPRATPDYGMS